MQPDGQVFKTAFSVDEFVALDDSDYVAWLANGNTVQTLTSAQLWQGFDDYSKLVYRPFSQSYDTSSDPDSPASAGGAASAYMEVPGPLGTVLTVFVATANDTEIVLPNMRSPRSPPSGTRFRFEMDGTSVDALALNLHTFAGQGVHPFLGAVYIGDAQEYVLQSKLTRGGTWKIVKYSDRAAAYDISGVSNFRSGVSSTVMVCKALNGIFVASKSTYTFGLDIIKANNLSGNVDISVAGPAAGGRDQAGAFVAGDSIWIYAILKNQGAIGYDSIAFIASKTSPDAMLGPTLPAGYTHWCPMGAYVLQDWSGTSGRASDGQAGVL